VQAWPFVLLGVLAALLAVLAVREWVLRRRGESEVAGWDEDDWASNEWTFLRTLYKEANGSPAKRVKQAKLVKRLNWSRPAFEAVRDQLCSGKMIEREKRRSREKWENAGLVERHEPTPADTIVSFLKLTAFGANKVRHARDAPTAARDLHADVINVIAGNEIGQGAVVMQDSRGNPTTNVTTQEIRTEYTQILDRFEASLRDEGTWLDPSALAAAQYHLAEARAELARGLPDTRTLTRRLQTLREIAVGAAGNAVWSGVVIGIDAVLRMLGS
jgi:hypothetical protein